MSASPQAGTVGGWEIDDTLTVITMGLTVLGLLYVCVQVRRQVGVNTANAIYTLKRRLLSPEMKSIWESMTEPSWVPVEGQEKHDAIEYLAIIEEACFLAFKSNHNMLAISTFYSWRIAAFLLNDWAWLRITGKKHRSNWVYIRSLVLHPRVFDSSLSRMLMMLRSRVADRKAATGRMQRALGRPLQPSEELKWEALLAAAGLGLPFRSVSDVPAAEGMVSRLAVHRRPYSVVEDSVRCFDGFRPGPMDPPRVMPSDIFPSYNLKRLARTWLGQSPSGAAADERAIARTADEALRRHVVVGVALRMEEQLPVAGSTETLAHADIVLVSPRPTLDLGMNNLPSRNIPPFSQSAVRDMLCYWMLSPADDAPPRRSLQNLCFYKGVALHALHGVADDENKTWMDLSRMRSHYHGGTRNAGCSLTAAVGVAGTSHAAPSVVAGRIGANVAATVAVAQVLGKPSASSEVATAGARRASSRPRSTDDFTAGCRTWVARVSLRLEAAARCLPVGGAVDPKSAFRLQKRFSGNVATW